jgi:hypothetical protein
VKGNVYVNENAVKVNVKNASGGLLESVSKNASAPRNGREEIKSVETKKGVNEMSVIVRLNVKSKIV